MRVFISSTFEDLKEHREVLTNHLRRMRVDELIRMEDFGSRSSDPQEVCREEIERCTIFIGIYAMRYGWLPKGSDISITEEEFDYARQLNKIVLCYTVEEDDWPFGKVERGEGEEKLKLFKENKIGTLVKSNFGRNPDELAAQILADLNYYAQEEHPLSSSDPLKLYPIHDDIGRPDFPYKSLEWFRREDARIFYGRSKDLATMFEKLANRYLKIYLLYGASGVGKSSFLHAGLTARSHLYWQNKYLRYHKGVIKEAELFLSEESELQKLVIIDQLEEIFFSLDSLDFFEHLEDLMMVNPGCKFILSFREEVLAAVESYIGVFTQAVGKYRLDHLSKEGVAEAICGVSNDAELSASYGILPPDKEEVNYIVRDIYAEKSKKDTIAPILQYTLRKIWDEWKNGKQKPGAEFRLTSELYKSTKQSTVDELLKSCLNEISIRYPRDVENGLVLDILHFFLSVNDTASKRTVKELREAYGHLDKEQGLHVKALCDSLCDRYFLLYIEEEEAYRLSHDALGPAIISMVNQSEADGQLIRRFLQSAENEHYDLTATQLIKILRDPKSCRRYSPNEWTIIAEYRNLYLKDIIQDHFQNDETDAAMRLMEETFYKFGLDAELKYLCSIRYQYNKVNRMYRLGLLALGKSQRISIVYQNNFLSLQEKLPFIRRDMNNYFWSYLKKLRDGYLLDAIQSFVKNCKDKLVGEEKNVLSLLSSDTVILEKKILQSEIGTVQILQETAILLKRSLTIIAEIFQKVIISKEVIKFAAEIVIEQHPFLEEIMIEAREQNYAGIFSAANAEEYFELLFYRAWLDNFQRLNPEASDYIELAKKRNTTLFFEYFGDRLNVPPKTVSSFNEWRKVFFGERLNGIIPHNADDTEEDKLILIVSELNSIKHGYLCSIISAEEFFIKIKKILADLIDLGVNYREGNMLHPKDIKLLQPLIKNEDSNLLMKEIINLVEAEKGSLALRKAIILVVGINSLIDYLEVQSWTHKNELDMQRNLIDHTISTLMEFYANRDLVKNEENRLVIIKENLRIGKIREAVNIINDFLENRNVKDENWSKFSILVEQEYYENSILKIRANEESSYRWSSLLFYILGFVEEFMEKKFSVLLYSETDMPSISFKYHIANSLVKGKWDVLYPFLRSFLVEKKLYGHLARLGWVFVKIKESFPDEEIEKVPLLIREILQKIFNDQGSKCLDLSHFRDQLSYVAKIDSKTLLEKLLNEGSDKQVMEFLLLLFEYEQVEKKNRCGILSLDNYFSQHRKIVTQLLNTMWIYSPLPLGHTIKQQL